MNNLFKKRPKDELEVAVKELIDERNQLLQQRDALARELLIMKKAANQEPVVVLPPSESQVPMVITNEDGTKRDDGRGASSKLSDTQSDQNHLMV